MNVSLHEAASTRQALRKLPACNECKRRKVRCSGGEKCTNCRRDGKECTYSSPLLRLTVAERRLHQAEAQIQVMERAWAIHLPNVDLKEALEHLRSGREEALDTEARGVEAPAQTSMPASIPAPNEQPPEMSPTEFSNAEDYEFDESQDFDNSTDGMGFLVAEPNKAGYMGPQSGVAALKFLQSLHLQVPLPRSNATSLDEPDAGNSPSASTADKNRYMNDYFSIYHPAYPILHEGTFRARASGALAKPRDGSWPILYNIVLAIGAFVGEVKEANSDVPFYRVARRNLNMDVLEKGSLSYVQGLVLMANYLQKRNKPNAGFVLIGIGFSMALAIGLHREFGLPHSSHFTMEIRRRVWWTLFIFVSGAQLTLGRPPVSLVGVNVHLPSNLDDQDLAVDMEMLPNPKEGPTVTSCLISQVKLATIANMVQVELLTNQIPNSEKAMSLDQRISSWRKELPSHFDEKNILDRWFEIPKRILIWRSFHLRIVLHRPILFQRITEKADIDVSIKAIHACLSGAEECVQSICAFVELEEEQPRGLAWYATYWLITASFVQATCYIYSPAHAIATVWREHLLRAVSCLSKLGTAHNMAYRARDVLKRLLDQSETSALLGDSVPLTAHNGQEAAFDFWQSNIPPWIPLQYQPSHRQGDSAFATESMMSFPWYAQGSTDAELLDATGAIMLQGNSDSAGPYFEQGSWMPA